jgi:hypothetical protein
MIYLTLFFCGAFLCNAIPHLVAGVQGAPFPTPFAKPPGVGNSSPLVNVLWASFNLAAGLALFAWHPASLGANLPCLALALGALAMGLFAAHHFGKVRSH